MPKPFLKWPGGKSVLLPELVRRMPHKYNTYYEPFLGGGALFWQLHPHRAVLSDVNEDLITTYQALRDSPYNLMLHLAQHKNDKAYYYTIRRADRCKSYKSWSDIKKASRFIFINKTSFNGLMRYNANGELNSSYGYRHTVTVCDTSRLINCSDYLSGVKLRSGCYSEILDNVKEGDFIYLDPPYDECYQGYTQDRFQRPMQLSLRGFCEIVDKRNAYFMLSNAATPLLTTMFADFNIETVHLAYKIGGNKKSRERKQEIIVTNYD